MAARVSFYTFHRWLLFVFNSLMCCFLPVLLAIPVRFLCMGEGEDFLDRFNIAAGVIWYTITFFTAIAYYAKGFRSDVYEYPVAEEIRADGTLRRIRRDDDIMITLPAMFGLGRKGPDGRRATMKTFFKTMKSHPCQAIVLFGIFFLTLYISVWMIVTF